MKILAPLFTALLLVTATSNVYAWGDREQGALTAIGGMLLLDHIANSSDTYRDDTYIDLRHYDRYDRRHFDPSRRVPKSLYCSSRVACAYERGARERQRRIEEQEAIRAYECGLYGKC